MENAVKYLALIGLVSAVSGSLVSCGQEPSAHPQTTVAHNESITRGSTAPAAPVQLTYQVPATIAANQPTIIDLAINTRLKQGAMLVEIAGHEGVAVLGDTQYRFDLDAISARPIPLQLKVLPADQAGRFLAVLITIDTEMGPMARSFRIDLQPNSPVPASANQPLIQQ
jgi:hypothetical protein